MTRERAEAVALAALCSYEALAIMTGRVPTVTNLVMRLPPPVRGLLSLAAFAWLLDHFEVSLRGSPPSLPG